MDESSVLVDTFSEHGLAGIVIGCLFLFMGVWFKFLQKVMEQHAQERREWHEAYKDISAKIDASTSRFYCKRQSD